MKIDEKGQRIKTGGRKKGTPNKSTKAIMEIIANSGVDPVEEILNIVQTTLDPGLKLRGCCELLKYMYPQRKAVDVEEKKVVEKIFVTLEEQQAVEAHIDDVIGIH